MPGDRWLCWVFWGIASASISDLLVVPHDFGGLLGGVLNARISNYSFDIEVVAFFAEGGFDFLRLDGVAHGWAKLLALMGHIKLTFLLLHLKKRTFGYGCSAAIRTSNIYNLLSYLISR